VITEKDYMKVNADGSVTISISYASRYVITTETPANDIQVDTAPDNSDMIDPITPAEPITPSEPATPTLPVTAGTQNNDTGSTFIWVLIGCAAVIIVICLGVHICRKRKRV
jgi:heme-binding NEAT domain protein